MRIGLLIIGLFFVFASMISCTAAVTMTAGPGMWQLLIGVILICAAGIIGEVRALRPPARIEHPGPGDINPKPSKIARFFGA
jgi:hypothetical protein